MHATKNRVEGLGYAPLVAWLAFDTNGSSDSPSTTWVGPLARFVTSITYSATGKHTIVFKEEFQVVAPALFGAMAQPASEAETFQVQVNGQYVVATRTLVVQTTRGATAREVPAGSAAGDSRIVLFLMANDSGGK